MTTLSNKILKPLQPFLTDTKKTDTGLVLTFLNFDKKLYSYSFDVATTLSVVQSLKLKVKYKGKKYLITNLSQQVTHQKYTIGLLGNQVSPSYLTGPGRTSLTVILEEIV